MSSFRQFHEIQDTFTMKPSYIVKCTGNVHMYSMYSIMCENHILHIHIVPIWRLHCVPVVPAPSSPSPNVPFLVEGRRQKKLSTQRTRLYFQKVPKIFYSAENRNISKALNAILKGRYLTVAAVSLWFLFPRRHFVTRCCPLFSSNKIPKRGLIFGSDKFA